MCAMRYRVGRILLKLLIKNPGVRVCTTSWSGMRIQPRTVYVRSPWWSVLASLTSNHDHPFLSGLETVYIPFGWPRLHRMFPGSSAGIELRRQGARFTDGSLWSVLPSLDVSSCSLCTFGCRHAFSPPSSSFFHFSSAHQRSLWCVGIEHTAVGMFDWWSNLTQLTTQKLRHA